MLVTIGLLSIGISFALKATHLYNPMVLSIEFYQWQYFITENFITDR